jgi:hypothetical protein
LNVFVELLILHQEMTSEDLPEQEAAEQGNAPAGSTAPNDEQKREIAGWVSEGMGLSDIQKKINTDFGVVMTYMDVRFLVDDLDLTLVDDEEPVSDDAEDGSDAEVSPDAPLQEGGGSGGVQVELDPVTPPGAMASGSVVFSDGEKKTWTLDQMGRIGLSGGEDGYKPSEEDVVEFQKELDSALRGKGF